MRMAYYSILIVDDQKTLSTPARDRLEAISIFGKDLGLRLTLEDNGSIPGYLLDEWESGARWVKHTIPVFVAT
jgi:hypothetical protein